MHKIKTCIWLLLAATVAITQPASANRIEELNSIAAVVDDDVITRLELDNRINSIKKQLAQQNTPLPPEEALQRRVLERMIVEKLQLAQAKQRGISVDDESLNKVITNIAAENNLSLVQFQEVLQRDGVDFAAFREQIRDEIIISRLINRVVTSRISISDQEVDSFLAAQQENESRNLEYRLSHILIALPEAASPEQVQEARSKADKVLEELHAGADFSRAAATWSDGQQALNGGDLGWRKAGELPTLFSETVLTMQPGEISALIRSPSGFHILMLNQTRGEQSHVIKQTHARHILIRTNDVVSDYEARSRLERLRERILNGEDFAELARTHSDDTGSGAKGGDLGWANPGSYVPAFEETMNSLNEGEISGPFKSRFGWHILQVMERRNHDDTEEFNRNNARQVLHKRKIEEEQTLWLRRLRDEAYVEYRLNS